MRVLMVVLALAGGLIAADDRVRVDNEAVRILKVTDMPHHKGAMHRHPMNRVMIYLDAGDIELTNEGGQKVEQHWQANQVAWSPEAGMHTSENVGNAPIRIVEIELKKPAPKQDVVRRPAFDAVALDPRHNVLILENDQVRVFRSWREPGATEPMHEHAGAGRAVILLTDLNGRVKMPDGTSTVQHGKAGDVLWSGPVTHATTNMGPQKFEMIVVEVK